MEQDRKFAIGRMISGLPIILEVPDLQGLATWIAARAMIFERMIPPPLLSPQRLPLLDGAQASAPKLAYLDWFVSWKKLAG